MSASGNEWHSKTAGDGTWESIRAPIDCCYYQVAPGVAFCKCSDKDDVDTSRAFDAGEGFTILAPATSFPFGIRWKQGEHITWIKSSAPLDLYFLR
jgi:hypothetical protein